MKDYFNIINGSFLNNLQISESSSSIGIKDFLLKKDNAAVLNIIIKENASYKLLNKKEIKILKDFYNSMTKYDDKINNKYIKNLIYRLLSLSNDELLEFCVKNKIDGLFYIDTIFFNGTTYLGMAEGKNNISNSKFYKDDNFLKKYAEIIKSILNVYIDVSDDMVKKIINYEINLYELKKTNESNRSINDIVNYYDITEFNSINFNFQNLIKLLLKDIPYEKKIIIDSKLPFTYYDKIDEYLGNVDFKYYIIWCILNGISSFTFGEANKNKFELIKIFKGIKKQDIEKKQIGIMNMALGHLISKEYYNLIDPKIKPRMDNLVEYLKRAFKERLIDNKWMDENTKKMAIQKLENMKVNIGNGSLIDFNSMSDMTPVFVHNLFIINEFLFTDAMNELVKYKQKFIGNIYEINAYYSPTKNQMTFPFGILQPPFFYNKNWNNLEVVAYNFGAIGSIIGHELIHGFDDQGRLFDKDGHLNNWWKQESEQNYKLITKKIGDIYKTYGINPELTMGENIADIGGVRISLTALKIYLQDNKKELDKKLIDMFIKAWAMIWRQKKTPQEAAARLINDPHSPVKERVNIPLNNLKEINPDKNDIIELW
jgi:predicted metalloendopeptidase